MVSASDDDDEQMWKGYFYAALLFPTTIVSSIFFQQLFYQSNIVGMNIRSAMMSAVYKKVLNPYNIVLLNIIYVHWLRNL